ncbi:Ral guanine nucleotide dissociation stimulator-like 1, partial [Manacus vitellinus]
EHTVRQYETSKIRAIKAGTLEKLVENLLTAFGDADFSYISIFLSTYRAFASTKAVLELLLDRFGNLETLSHGEVANLNSFESEVTLRAEIASVLRAWLDQCSEDFREPPDHTCLLKLLDYLKNNMPNSDMESKVQNLLKQFQNQEAETVEPEHLSSLYSFFFHLFYANLIFWSFLSRMQHSGAITSGRTLGVFCCNTGMFQNKQAPALIHCLLCKFTECWFPSCPDGFCSTSSSDLVDGEELEISNPEEFSSFQDHIVAEQLTYMDVMLFKKVVPYHCLGSIWSQRDKKENKNLAPTVRATITQFNTVTKCVVSTILGTKELKIQQRAKIIEKWIHIAHECRILKNFSSLRAIISALQSNSIYRLKTTWMCVSKDILLMYEELSEIFSDHDNYLTSRELLMKEATSKFANLDSSEKENQKKSQKRLQLQKNKGVMQGTVPYLGTFLTDLIMLDTALQDYVEGGLINFEKRRREFEVIAQIKLLQSSCNSYCLIPDQKFIQWFRSQRHLTEEESYKLSREVEAAADTNILSPKSQKSMVKRISTTPSSGVSPLPSFPTLLPSSDDKSSVGSDKGYDSDKGSIGSDKGSGSNKCSIFDKGSGSDKYSIFDKASGSDSGPVSDKSPGSTTCSTSKVLPVYNRQNGGACIIRVSMDGINDSVYKSILITNQDRIPDVTQRALLKHNLEPDAVEDYELVQVISEDKELVFPRDANVFYGMNSHVNFDFILRKK